MRGFAVATVVLAVFVPEGNIQNAYAGEVPFVEHAIPSSGAGGFRSIFPADMDGDGDIDIVAAGFDPSVSWFENDGSSPPNFNERSIATVSALAWSLFVVDLNEDGYLDVVAGFRNPGLVVWYESDGGSPPTFQSHSVSMNEAFSVFAIDVNGDDAIDILSSGQNSPGTFWYQSSGGVAPTFQERVMFEFSEGRSVIGVDVDSDEDVDVIVGGSSVLLALYENDGSAIPMFSQVSVSNTVIFVDTVSAADLDGDGDQDIISGAQLGNTLAWQDNDGQFPSTFTERVISTSGAISAVFPADVDNDGDTDLLTACESICADGAESFSWYENDGLNPPAFAQRVVASGSFLRGCVRSRDIADKDGNWQGVPDPWRGMLIPAT